MAVGFSSTLLDEWRYRWIVSYLTKYPTGHVKLSELKKRSVKIVGKWGFDKNIAGLKKALRRVTSKHKGYVL